MKKKLIFALCGIFIIPSMWMVVAKTQKTKINAASSYFQNVSIAQHSRFQLDVNESYTALNTSGSFLSDRNSTTTPVDHSATLPIITDNRNSRLIKQVKMPAYADIQSSISNSHLNNLIPTTDRWWLADTLSVYTIDSAKVVNENNNLGDSEYTSPTYPQFDWIGALPITDKKTWSEDFYDPDADGMMSYKSAQGSGAYYNVGNAFSVELCPAIIIEDVLQPCNSTSNNTSITYNFPSNVGCFFGLATMNTSTHTLTFNPQNSYQAGDLIGVGELSWSGRGDPTDISLMVVATPFTVDRPIRTANQSIFSWGATGSGINHPAAYKGTISGDINVTKQKAHIRPLINFALSEIKYVSKKGEVIAVNSYKAPLTSTQSDVTYLPHVNDASIAVTALGENQSGKVKISNSQRLIKIPAGTETIALPVYTTPLNTGFERYVSAMNNNGLYGKIGKLNSDQGTLGFNISALVDVNAVGSKTKIQLYAEDIQKEGTSYISAPFEVEIEITEKFKMEYTAKPQAADGVASGKYQHLKNVNVGDKIGEVSIAYGIEPYTLTLLDDDSGSGDYQYFELAQTSNITDGTVDVKIRANTSGLLDNSLKAGTYKFCIEGKDSSGNGPDANDPIKVCTSLVVEKTKLTVAFKNPDQTKKSVVEAEDPWSELATAKPSAGTKITYTVTGGDIGLIRLDRDTGEIEYVGNGNSGKVTIRATADDDPDSGDDSYEPAYVEKEIVIVKEVDGVLTPHEDSSDTTVPTFTAMQPNVKTGGIIGTIKGILGTPDDITHGPTTYSYAIKNDGDGSYFRVDSVSGVITSNANLAVNSYHFTITVSDKWCSKDIAVTVNVGVSPAEQLKFYENKTSNTIIDKKTVDFTDTNVSVYATVKGSTNNNPVTYKIKDGSTNIITINPNSGAVTIKGTGTVTIVAEKKGVSGQADAVAELSFTVKEGKQKFIYTTDSTLSKERPKTGEKYNTLKESYAPNKTFYVYTTGNPAGSSVTYKLKDTSPEDVISVDPDGKIHILNASMNNQIGKVIVEATSHDPNGNYDDVTIELPIDIERGTRKIEFAENPINVVSGSGSVVPIILVDGKTDLSGNTTIEVDSAASDIAWTSDGTKIDYEWNDEKGKDVKLHVTKPADRNYKAAEADGKLHILGADENVLTLSTPGKVTYGDHFTIRSTQDDSMSTNVQYTFETDNGVYISAPKVNGNKAEFDALRYSGSTEITIKVTRTADGELPLTKRVKIKVLPKPITIQIEDKEKLRLQDNPELTYKDFSGKLVTWNGVKDEIDTSVIKLTTTAGKYSPIGSYPITSKAEKLLNDNYPNYKFTIQRGKLNVKDNGDKNFWDIDNDGCPDTNIELKDEHGETILINGDKNDDGIPDYNVDINGDGKPDLNIDTDNDGKPDVNLVILKSWKPSKCVMIGDIQYASGISAKAEINVDIDGDRIPDINIDNNGDMKADINISKDGKTPIINIAVIHDWKPVKDYKVDKFLYDSIGKEGAVPELNIDTDGDGRPDINLDLDHDGIPDLNIDWDGDWIPDTQIDSDGDGKPDINIDTDGNGIPDENIVEIEEWKPNKNVDGELPYDTMDFSKTDDPNGSDQPNNPNDKNDFDNTDQPNGTNKPNDTNHPNDNDQTGNDTDVKGAYYPGKDVGGAMTGDESHLYLYTCILFLSLGNLCYLYNKAVNRIKTK